MKAWTWLAAVITLALAVAWPVLTVAATAGPAPAGTMNFWHHPTPAAYFYLLGAGTAPGTGLPLFFLLVLVWGLAFLLGLHRRTRTRRRYTLPPPPKPGLPDMVWWRDCPECAGHAPELGCGFCSGAGGRWEYPDSTPAPPPRRELR